MIRRTLLGLFLTITTVTCFAQQYGSFKDPRDGRVYKTVKIGEQEWLAQDLDVDRFRNGDPIPQAKSNEEWKRAGENKQPAWCYYDNDDYNSRILGFSDGTKYGKLYNWYAVNDSRGLAPSDWYIPSNLDWISLENLLGGDEIAGQKMKSKNGWNSNGNGTNESGFSGLPTGRRVFTSIGVTEGFRGIGDCGNWWSSTESSKDSAWIVYLLQDYKWSGRTYGGYKSAGYPVRCVREVNNTKINNAGLKQNTTTNNNNSVNNSPLFNCSDLILKVKHKMDNTKLSITGDGAKDADNFIEKIIKPAASEYTASLISNANRVVSKEEKEAIANQTINCIKNINFKFNNSNTQSNRNNNTTGNPDPLSSLISDYLFNQTFRSPSNPTNNQKETSSYKQEKKLTYKCLCCGKLFEYKQPGYGDLPEREYCSYKCKDYAKKGWCPPN